MHRRDAATEELTRAVIAYALQRGAMDPPPLDGPRTVDELRAEAGETITRTGIGGLEALRVFTEVLGPACVSEDHPRMWSFIPAAPTESSVLFDLVVGASSVLAGLPAEAGGTFVSGGTAGNLSALVAALHRWRARAAGEADRVRGLIVCA